MRRGRLAKLRVRIRLPGVELCPRRDGSRVRGDESHATKRNRPEAAMKFSSRSSDRGTMSIAPSGRIPYSEYAAYGVSTSLRGY